MNGDATRAPRIARLRRGTKIVTIGFLLRHRSAWRRRRAYRGDKSMRKTLSILAAVALLGASTAGAAAQSVRPASAPEPAAETVTEGSALDSEETLGVIFGLVTIAILIWLLGEGDDPEPSSPCSPLRSEIVRLGAPSPPRLSSNRANRRSRPSPGAAARRSS